VWGRVLARPRRATLGYWVSPKASSYARPDNRGVAVPTWAVIAVPSHPDGWMVGAVGFEPTTSTV
jgi:hypothetical protein